jgi:thiol-disulfide isomerase/thioredoxin
MIPTFSHFRCGAAWLAVTLLGAALAMAPAARAQIKVGDRFPALPATALDSADPAMRAKVLLVDFWASWCAPCRSSFPAFKRIYADFAARGLAIVAIGVDENPADYDAFVKGMAPPFATARDLAQKLVREVQVPAMPTSYLIGRDGRVRYIHPGFHGKPTERELRAEIESLLAEDAKTASP